jgi:hypothetical protein
LPQVLDLTQWYVPPDAAALFKAAVSTSPTHSKERAFILPSHPNSSDPMLVSQADALQAEASTKLKGMLSASAAPPPSPAKLEAIPVPSPPASVGDLNKAASSEVVCNKRLRDPNDEPASNKRTPAPQSGSPEHIATKTSPSPSRVPPPPAAAVASKSIKTEQLETVEESVSSIEGHCVEVEDVQAKYQAELAWCAGVITLFDSAVVFSVACIFSFLSFDLPIYLLLI